MRRIISLLIIVAFAGFNARAQYVSLTNAEFTKLGAILKTDAEAKKTFEYFQATADKALTETPNPIEEITSEGMLAGHPDKVKSLKAVEDADKIYALALVYKLYGNKACLDKATEYLLAWAKVNKSSGDPIDETKLEPLFTGYDILRSSIKADAQKTIDIWLDSIAQGELNSDYAKPGQSTATNNWNSHRLKIIAMIAYAIHSDKYNQIIEKEMAKQIAINLYADGSGYDFKERDALHYHIYTLEPLVMAAIVIKRATGKDFFNYESEKGSSIKKSMEFLVPFVTGEKTHGEFLNSKSGFDRARAKNGEQGYVAGALFHPNTAIYVLELASYFDIKYADVVLKSFPQGKHKHDWELLLNKVRSH
ncbi:MAG: alginate lyase family protein [Mucilaginibacter sp.]|uniref:alginate lyase family protein n=1 Tax=Mucilaginibacter sp. TaxID=1882438 RepID=UPI0032630B60